MSSMRMRYPTILVLGGLVSAIVVGIASFSRYRKVSPTRELQNKNKDKVKSISTQDRDLAQIAKVEGGIQEKATATTVVGLDKKVQRVKKYRSNGKPIYE
jgi:hypothetical protein